MRVTILGGNAALNAGDGTVVRDFIHVDDVARAMATALTLAERQ